MTRKYPSAPQRPQYETKDIGRPRFAPSRLTREVSMPERVDEGHGRLPGNGIRDGSEGLVERVAVDKGCRFVGQAMTLGALEIGGCQNEL